MEVTNVFNNSPVVNLLAGIWALTIGLTMVVGVISWVVGTLKEEDVERRNESNWGLLGSPFLTILFLEIFVPAAIGVVVLFVLAGITLIISAFK